MIGNSNRESLELKYPLYLIVYFDIDFFLFYM